MTAFNPSVPVVRPEIDFRIPTGPEVPAVPKSHHIALDYLQGEETYLITSEGGGGHKSAADAIQYKLLNQADNQEGVVRRVDVLKNTIIPNFICDMATGAWDKAKKEGNIEKQVTLIKGKFLGLISYRSLAEFLFFIPVFLKTFFTLWGNRKITRIVDTQPLGTGAIIAAARLVNYLFHRHVQIYKIMTDLPTDQAIHFADSAKGLSAADKKIYHLISTNPFPKLENETEENYDDRMDSWWKEHFNLSLKEGQVSYGDFPLRPAFIRAKDGELTGDIGVKLNNPDETRILREAGIIDETALIEKQGKALNQKTGVIDATSYSYAPVQIGDKDMVGLITLGSQANTAATKAYIDDVLELVKRFNALVENGEGDAKKFHLFVACGKHEPGKTSLFSEIAEMIKAKKALGEFPDNLNIVPMGFQSDEEMAPLMHRADFGIYAAGGLTTMESITASDPSRAHLFIHSDAKGATETMTDNEVEEELLKGFALWEKGNAEFQLKNDAELVSPNAIFSKRLWELFDVPKIEEVDLDDDIVDLSFMNAG